MNKTVWWEGCLQISDIRTKNVREDLLNPKLGHDMIILENWRNTFKIGVIVYRRVWKTMWFEWLEWIDLSIRLNEYEMLIWVYNDELGFRMMGITLKNGYVKQCEISAKKTMYK